MGLYLNQTFSIFDNKNEICKNSTKTYATLKTVRLPFVDENNGGKKSYFSFGAKLRMY